MTASVPWISIICNTFNHEVFIEKALDGFLSQGTSFPFEITIQTIRENQHPYGYFFDLNDTRYTWLTQPLTWVFRKDDFNPVDFKGFQSIRDIHRVHYLLKKRKRLFCNALPWYISYSSARCTFGFVLEKQVLS